MYLDIVSVLVLYLLRGTEAFEWLFLTFIYHHIYIIIPHTNTTISVRFCFFDDFGIVYIDLVVVSLLINLPLYYFAMVHTKFFPTKF